MFSAFRKSYPLPGYLKGPGVKVFVATCVWLSVVFFFLLVFPLSVRRHVNFHEYSSLLMSQFVCVVFRESVHKKKNTKA